MPLHRSTHEHAREEIARLEAEGHTVTAIATDDGGVYVVTSQPKAARKSGQTETR